MNGHEATVEVVGVAAMQGVGAEAIRGEVVEEEVGEVEDAVRLEVGRRFCKSNGSLVSDT